MARHIARRLVLLLPSLLGLSLAAFILLRLIPGDPVQVMLGERAAAGSAARLRAEQGLDRPLPVQYLHYLGRLTRGDWGKAIKTGLPVTDELAQRLPATMELGMAALAVACALGVPLGVLAACRRGLWPDVAVSSGSLLGVSMPLFWLGLMLGHFFGYRLGWLPPSGRLSAGTELLPLGAAYPIGAWLRPAAGFVSGFYVLDSLLTGNWAALIDALRHLALPALTLSVAPLAVVVRMTRACLVDALAADHTRTARAKGLPERAVVVGHALRGALLPIVTAIGLQAGSLFSGAVLTETIFSWPGLGQFVADRVLNRDYPAVQGAILATALVVLAIDLATDVACAALDPRLRDG